MQIQYFRKFAEQRAVVLDGVGCQYCKTGQTKYT